MFETSIQIRLMEINAYSEVMVQHEGHHYLWQPLSWASSRRYAFRTARLESVKPCLHPYCIGALCNCRSNLKRGFFCGACFGR